MANNACIAYEKRKFTSRVTHERWKDFLSSTTRNGETAVSACITRSQCFTEEFHRWPSLS